MVSSNINKITITYRYHALFDAFLNKLYSPSRFIEGYPDFSQRRGIEITPERETVKLVKLKSLIIGIILALLPGHFQAVWAGPLSLEKNIQAIQADPSGLEKGFPFIVLGDVRGNEEVYARLLVKAKSFNPLFILNTGDIVNWGQAYEYENYLKRIAALDIPMLHIPGNHDINLDQSLYREYLGLANWSFDYGNYRFIGLDNAAGNFSRETIAFAAAALTDRKTCLVAFHKPPAVGRWAVHAMQADATGGRGGEMMTLIKKAGVSKVFLGHIHLYDEMEVDGVQYIISAGGGAKLYGKYGFGKAEYGFVLVRVGADGLTHQWIPLE